MLYYYPSHKFVPNGGIIWIDLNFLQQSGTCECSCSDIVREGDESFVLNLVDIDRCQYAHVFVHRRCIIAVDLIGKHGISSFLRYGISWSDWRTVFVFNSAITDGPNATHISLRNISNNTMNCNIIFKICLLVCMKAKSFKAFNEVVTTIGHCSSVPCVNKNRFKDLNAAIVLLFITSLRTALASRRTATFTGRIRSLIL